MRVHLQTPPLHCTQPPQPSVHASQDLPGPCISDPNAPYSSIWGRESVVCLQRSPSLGELFSARTSYSPTSWTTGCISALQTAPPHKNRLAAPPLSPRSPRSPRSPCGAPTPSPEPRNYPTSTPLTTHKMRPLNTPGSARPFPSTSGPRPESGSEPPAARDRTVPEPRPPLLPPVRERAQGRRRLKVIFYTGKQPVAQDRSSARDTPVVPDLNDPQSLLSLLPPPSSDSCFRRL